MAETICSPGTRVRSYLQEVLKISPADLRDVAIPLQAALAVGATTASDANYNIPSDQHLYVYGISGFISPNAIASEPTAHFGWLNLDPSERYLLKAMNCAVQLENITRQHKIFDGREAMLSSLMPPFGTPLQWSVETPLVFSSAHVLKATFTLQDTSAAAVGASTDYGILLTGVLVPIPGAR